MVPAAATVSDMNVGQMLIPAGYTCGSYIETCTTDQSITNPLCLTVAAMSPDQNTLMAYQSSRTYIELLGSAVNGIPGNQHQEGVFDLTTMTCMRKEKSPREYADYFARLNVNSNIWLTLLDQKEDRGALRAMQDIAAKQKKDLEASAPDGMSFDYVTLKAGEYRYSYTYGGVPYYLIISTCVNAVRTSYNIVNPAGSIWSQYTIWNVPYTYMLLCPASEYKTAYAKFQLFMENTTCSDQFTRANSRLSEELVNEVTNNGGLTGSEQTCARILKQEAASGCTADDERYSDCLFEETGYAHSSGMKIRVLDAYPYVYEGSDGTVYFGGSAFTPPAGSQPLAPAK